MSIRVRLCVAPMGVVIALAVPLRADSGRKITIRHSYADVVTEEIHYADAARKRVEHRVLAPAYAVRESVEITRCDREERIMLLPAERTYFRRGHAVHSRVFFFAPSWRKPPPPPPTDPPQTEIVVETSTVDTAERKTAFGLTARRVVTTQTHVVVGEPVPLSQSTTDGWYVDLEQLPACDSEVRHARLVTRVLRAGDQVHASDPIKYTYREVGTPERGFAVQTTTIDRERRGTGLAERSRRTTTVTGVSSVVLDPAMFGVPAGYRRGDGFAAWVSDSLSSAWQTLKYGVLRIF